MGSKKADLDGLEKTVINYTTQSRFVYSIAELMSDLELGDYATTDHCGTCTACIDACQPKQL
jgi:epoxyqueuosine reductase